jgi:phosphatidylserine/phosphatidylglycerophosphate/cardiolipin synthase-like enzyme
MLHAKLYIFDRKQLIITSANLTISGFRRNLEYGVFMDDAELVDKALEDYDSICSNETTGKIRLSNINEIKNVLRTLPEYHEYIPADDTENNEIDNIIPINKEVVTQQLSLWKKTTFLVVDGIEKNEFCLEDVYRQEQIFMQKFRETIR